MFTRLMLLGVLLAVGPAIGQYEQHSIPIYDRAPSQPQLRQPCVAVSARVDLLPGVTGTIRGALFFYQECPDQPVHIAGRLTGLTPGKHGLHVHEKPNLGGKCSDAGGHYNPFKTNHGAQTNDIQNRHLGDLGNIVANFEGVAEIRIKDPIINLFPGVKSILGRAMVVHSGEDDLGLGGDEGSLKTGNAGMRVGCGVIAPNNFSC